MKWIVRLLGLVIVLAVVLVGALFFLPADRVARIATEQLSAATGRDVAINGEVSLTFWPVLGVSADDLEVGNADWAEQGPMLQAANAAIGIDVMSLLRGNIRITNIEANSPTIRLEQRADGRASWEFTDAGGAAQIETETSPQTAPESDTREISIEKLSVTDATLIYDAEGSDLVSLDGVDLFLNWPDPAGPADITAQLQPAGTPVAVEAVVDVFASFITGEISPLRAVVRADAGTIDFDGRGSTTGAVAGLLSLQTTDTDAFLQSLALPGADLPPKLGRSLDLSTDLTLTPDRQLSLRDLILDLGGNRLTGAADLSLNGVPQINAQLNAGALDLTQGSSRSEPSSDGGGTSSEPSANAGGWPTTPIDASALSAFNGDIALSADSIDLGSFQLGQTRAVLRNENARLVFDLRQVEAYGGNVTGEFVVNNRGNLSIGGNMDVASVQLQPLLADAIDVDRLTGQGDLKVSFVGSGRSVDAIMRSLGGDGSLNVGRGTIEGIDLDQLLRGGNASGTTIFDDLTATWTIASGVLSNNDLLFQLKNYEASGAGVVGLGAQTIDYTFTPVALRANSGEGLAIPVRFTGPWADIAIRPDVEAALDLRLDAEKEALEERAREEISERLGVGTTEGQSTEDAIKDEAKDRLLRRLFD
ncbi:AsmA family protein [Roseobacter weihaiensis]|uniref:AsmA family protein n=1 Tax=Roseobacter weihaiensis TaxID=2763262 RepID=UPI001D0BA5E1|nr:AsmA family protein [Roseobacter sp. H9]